MKLLAGIRRTIHYILIILHSTYSSCVSMYGRLVLMKFKIFSFVEKISFRSLVKSIYLSSQTCVSIQRYYWLCDDEHIICINIDRLMESLKLAAFHICIYKDDNIFIQYSKNLFGDNEDCSKRFGDIAANLCIIRATLCV